MSPLITPLHGKDQWEYWFLTKSRTQEILNDLAFAARLQEASDAIREIPLQSVILANEPGTSNS